MMSPVHIAALFILQTDDAAVPVPHSPLSGFSAVIDMVRNSGPVAIAVLVLLLIASLYSWAIILGKSALFRRARSQSRRFMRAFRKADRLQEISAVSDQFKPSPLVTVFDEVYDTYRRQTGGFGPPKNIVTLERAAQAASSESLTVLERRLTWLATIGAVSPFVGLFGTVMGIVDAFHGLGTEGAATLRAVAPGVSEALSPPPLVCWSPSPPLSPTTSSLHRCASSAPAWTTSPASYSTAWKKSAPNRKRWRGRPQVAFTASTGHTRTSLAEINITPLVDVVLVLLIIFMVTAPVLQSGIDVSVPKTRSVKEITQQRLVLTIDRDQNVFLGDKPVNLAQLPTLLHQPKTDPASQVIYLRADERVPFGAFASVMDAVKQAGISNISIVTQPLQKSAK